MPPLQGDIVSVWTEGADTCMAVAVVERQRIDGQEQDVTVEYIGRVPTTELEGKTKAETKQALRQAVKAVRDAQTGRSAQAVTGMTGKVDL